MGFEGEFTHHYVKVVVHVLSKTGAHLISFSACFVSFFTEKYVFTAAIGQQLFYNILFLNKKFQAA